MVHRREENKICSLPRDISLMIHSTDVTREEERPRYPLHGTLFTARLPPSIGGGKYATLRLTLPGGIFKGYSASVVIGRQEEEGQLPALVPAEVLRTLREGDACRFLVYDSALETRQPPNERNWFAALIVRPLYSGRQGIILPQGLIRMNLARADLSDQVLVEPQETNALFKAAAQADPIVPEGKGREVIYNDWVWLRAAYLRNRSVIEVVQASLNV